jgi:hypothetical protein
MRCQTTALKMSASRPSWLLVAVATTMLWASILLPVTPPVLLLVQIRTWVAVIFWRLPNEALVRHEVAGVTAVLQGSLRTQPPVRRW